jgi:hypothetical protein
MAPVFGLSNIGRRLVESVVGLFAILGFVYVPLGRHTGFEHAKAVFSTPAATSAIDDLTTTALGLRQRALDFVTGRLAAPAGATAGATEADGPAAEAAPKAHGPGREPRPVPPKLK